jgi:tetratricopeptide (TPR) repeat protein
LILIILISFFAYFPVLQNGLLEWDDYGYIKNNPLIYSINLNDIFSHNVMWNYHPLTILILAIEYQFFGLNATGYHAVNLLLHLLNVVLVFYAVLLLSDKVEVALVASLLFGIHPIHVESVAWVAELKDLLYTFFFLASYIFYLKYMKIQQRKFYVFALLLFSASLLSKAMAASLPVILVLTDYFKERKINRKTLLEKAPFFLLAITLGVIAVFAQGDSVATQDLGFSVFQRIVFACYGFITYLAKLLLPINLSAFYPYPILNSGVIPLEYYVYVLFVLGIAVYVFYSLRFSKKIFFSLGFFTVTILLVLQLLPVGNAIMADRYSYIPSIGIFYLIGEGLTLLWNKKQKLVTIVLISAFTVLFSVKTYARCGVWSSDLSLWNDVISQFQTAPIAYNNRGLAFLNEKSYDRALEDFNKAINLYPNYTLAYINRGNVLRDQHMYNEALSDYNKAIELEPTFHKTYFNRGTLFLKNEKSDDALCDFNKAIDLNPSYTEAYINRGLLFMNEKKYDRALADYNKAIDLNPNYIDAYINRGNLFSMENRYEEAVDNFSKAILLKPNGAIAFYNRGLTEYRLGKKDAACLDLKRAYILGYKPAFDALVELCK